MRSDDGNEAASSAYILEARNIVKLFGDLRANDDIDLSLKPRRDPRAAGRERRRQVHPGEDHLRCPAADIGAALLEGSSGDDSQSGHGAGAGHRHGVSALLAVRCAHRHAKHRACPQGGAEHGGAGRADRDRLRRLRFAASARRGRGGSFGGRAPAHRGRALPFAGAAPADPGRAHGGPDAAGGRSALRHPGAPGRRRLRGALHFPSPGRGQTPLPRRDDPAPWTPGGAGRSTAGIRRFPRQAHDRQRRRSAQAGERCGTRRTPARARRSLHADR